MLRADIEKIMKEKGLTQIDLVFNEDDKLAMYCMLKNGKLYDYMGKHVIDRKKDIWGYLHWENGKSTRVAW